MGPYDDINEIPGVRGDTVCKAKDRCGWVKGLVPDNAVTPHTVMQSGETLTVLGPSAARPGFRAPPRPGFRPRIHTRCWGGGGGGGRGARGERCPGYR